MGLLDAVGEIGEAVANVGKSIGQDFDDVGPLGRLIPMTGVIDKFLLAANSPILVGGQMVIAGMRRTTGTGEPDTGEQFGRGSQRFGGASDTLASAAPTEDWTGSGADAYDGQNHRQTGRTATLADLDRKVQTVIACEAFQIKYRRGKLDDQSNWLADVGHTTYGLGLVPGIGPALKAVAETQAVIAAVGSSSMELASLSNEVGVNASAVQGLVGQYQEVSRSTGGSAMSPPPAPPGGPGDDPTDRPDEEHSPAGDPTEDDPTGTPPDGRSSAPAGGGGGGTPSGGGGGGSPTGGPPRVPTPQPPIPSVAPPSLPQAPTSGGSTGASSGVPAPMGALPSATSGTPATAGTAGATSALAPLIQAAVQRAFEQHSAEEKAREEEQKRAEQEAKKDSEKDPEDPAKDENGNGIPDAEEGAVAESASGAVDGGRTPVHVEFNVDPERVATSMTVTLDQDRSLVVPPTATT
jgi:hypothetical protein